MTFNAVSRICGSRSELSDSGVPNVPNVQGVQGVSNVPNVPNVQGVQGVQGVPNVQGVQGVQGVPNVQGVPTVVGVPCFSGAPWDFASLTGLDGLSTRTMRLPEDVSDIDGYADFLANEVRDLDSFVLAGDSFGAVISLALAARQPRGLVGLVLSGGFAANPLPAWKGVAAKLSRYANGVLYRQGVLRFHSFQLASRFDATGEVPQTQNDFRDLFVENTPRSSYTARVTSVTGFDMVDRLDRVVVPTLLITPADDRLVGVGAAQRMLSGIPHVSEIVLPETGHMFRFTHPELYSAVIRDFVWPLTSARDSAQRAASAETSGRRAASAETSGRRAADTDTSDRRA